MVEFSYRPFMGTKETQCWKTMSCCVSQLFVVSSAYMRPSETWQPEPASSEFTPWKKPCFPWSIVYFLDVGRFHLLQKLQLSSCFSEHYCSLFFNIYYSAYRAGWDHCYETSLQRESGSIQSLGLKHWDITFWWSIFKSQLETPTVCHCINWKVFGRSPQFQYGFHQSVTVHFSDGVEYGITSTSSTIGFLITFDCETTGEKQWFSVLLSESTPCWTAVNKYFYKRRGDYLSINTCTCRLYRM